MKLCSVIDCNSTVYAKELCKRHYYQVRKFGAVKRTKFDCQIFEIHNGDCEILLYNNRGEFVSKTVVDASDSSRVSGHKWHMLGSGYVQSSTAGRLNRYILGCSDPNVFVDHIDRDKLNNRKSNLRVCTNSENLYNMKSKRKYKVYILAVVCGLPRLEWGVRDFT